MPSTILTAKRALITGGAGFLGRYLQESLRRQGCEVILAGRASIGDIAQAASWRRCLEEARPDVIYHLLGVVDAPDDAAFEAAHLLPTRALLQAVLELEMKTTPIFILGSAAEYGDVPLDRQPISEEEPARPLSAYGRSKLQATNCALDFAARGLPVIVVRLFNVFGRGMSTRMLPGNILAQLQSGAPQIKTGPVDRVRDFLRADVAMDALAQLGTKEIPGGTILNLCSGVGLSSREIVSAILAAAGRTSDLVIDDEDSSRSGGVRRSIGNPARVTKLLGFRPRPPELSDFAQLIYYSASS